MSGGRLQGGSEGGKQSCIHSSAAHCQKGFNILHGGLYFRPNKASLPSASTHDMLLYYTVFPFLRATLHHPAHCIIKSTCVAKLLSAQNSVCKSYMRSDTPFNAVKSL